MEREIEKVKERSWVIKKMAKKEKEVKERERKEEDTTRLEIPTEGKGLGGSTADNFNSEHEYLSSLCVVGGFLFSFFCFGPGAADTWGGE